MNLSIFRQDRIFGGAVVLAITQFAASFVGLLRDRALASTFPGLGIVDVYIASFRPSDLLFQVCIMAGYSVALVPLLARHKADQNQEELSGLLNGVLCIAALVFGVIALLLGIFFPVIAPHLAQFTGEKMELYIHFGRIALLTNFLFVFGNAFGQYLITIQRYWIYGLTPVFYTLGTIFGTFYLTPEFGPLGPMYGTLLGSVLYILFRLGALIHNGYRPKFKWWHPDLSQMGILMLPRMLALGALQFELLLFDRVASGLDDGSITINAYARNFQSVVVGVAGIALAQSVFSLLSQSAAKRDMLRFWIYMRKSIMLLLLVTIPGGIALVLVTPIAAKLVSLSHVLPVFGMCLALYAISIPFESINHLVLRAFYSLKKTTVPAIFSVLNGFVAIAVAWMLAPKMGVYSLALAFTAGQIVQLVGLGLLLPRAARS